MDLCVCVCVRKYFTPPMQLVRGLLAVCLNIRSLYKMCRFEKGQYYFAASL